MSILSPSPCRNSSLSQVCARSWGGAVASIALCLATLVSAADLKVTVTAGSSDRSNCLVRVTLPSDGEVGGRFFKTDGAETLQWHGGKDATLFIPFLKSNTTRVLNFKATEARSGTGLRAGKTGNKLRISSGEKNLLEYQAEPGKLPRENIKEAFVRGGYLHPIVTPSGRVVTDDFPANHIHHHGIWMPWTKTKFQGREPDFWNMGEKKGRVEFVSHGEPWSGPLEAGFKARHRFVDLLAPEPTEVLREEWEVRVFPTFEKDFWIFDLSSRQECATSDPLELPEYHYGGLGLRGNWAWNGATNVRFLTSSGETNRLKGNGTRGNWCDMSGLVDGQPVGIAVLGHPENFRAPQPMRLHPTEPFFCFAPQHLGDMAIKPGQPYLSRYRFVVHDGWFSREKLERLWQDYADPPRVKVELVKN